MMQRVAVALFALALARQLHAGHLQKISTVELSDSGVFAVRFSPDGKQLLVLAGSAQNDEHLILLDVEKRDQTPGEIEVNPAQLESNLSGPDLDEQPVIRWSASGSHAIIGSNVLELASGRVCELPTSFSFYPGYFFVTPTEIMGIVKETVFRYSADCSLQGKEELAEYRRILDAAPERNLIATFDAPTAFFSVGQIRVWNSTTNTPLRELRGTQSAVLAANGSTLCRIVGSGWQRAVECSSPSGTRSTPVFTGALALRAGAGSTRVVISEYYRKFDFIDWFWGMGSLRRRVVWDFESGKEIAAWAPKSQAIEGVRHPLRFDISPDGHFIAEAGAGHVVLYRIGD